MPCSPLAATVCIRPQLWVGVRGSDVRSLLDTLGSYEVIRGFMTCDVTHLQTTWETTKPFVLQHMLFYLLFLLVPITVIIDRLNIKLRRYLSQIYDKNTSIVLYKYSYLNISSKFVELFCPCVPLVRKYWTKLAIPSAIVYVLLYQMLASNSADCIPLVAVEPMYQQCVKYQHNINPWYAVWYGGNVR